MFCPECGKQIPDDSVFCEVCGARIDEEPEEYVVPEVVQTTPAEPAPKAQEPVQVKEPAKVQEPAKAQEPARVKTPVENPQDNSADSLVKTPIDNHAKKTPYWLIAVGVVIILAVVIAVVIGRKGKGGEGDESKKGRNSVAEVTESDRDETEEDEGNAKNDKDSDKDDADKGSDSDSAKDDNTDTNDTDGNAGLIPEGEDDIPQGLDTEGIEGIVDIDEPGMMTMAEVAANLSTDANASATDFEWFIDSEIGDGYGAGIVLDLCDLVIGEGNEMLNGGWKAYMLDTLTKPYAPETERYFNVTVDSAGTKFKITTNWALLYFPKDGQSVNEEGSDVFEGTWDPETGKATATSSYGKIEFDNFYISEDAKAEYAVGTFYWNSGETERIGLMRVNR